MKKDIDVKVKKLNKQRARLTVDYFFHRGRYAAYVILFMLFAIVFGVLAVVRVGYPTHYIFSSVCLLLLLFAILTIVKVFSNQIDCVTLERLMAKDREVAYAGLFDHLAIVNDRSKYLAEPIELVVPQVYPGRTTLLYRYDKKSQKLYYSQTGYTWILFGESNLFTYNVSVNHIHGFVGYECADEISYSDVVNVQSRVEKENGIETLMVTLSLINSEKIDICLRRRATRAEKYLNSLPKNERKALINSGAQFEGSTDALNDREKELIARIRLAIRNNK